MNKQSKLSLNENPKLQDFQRYVQDMEKERGFTEETTMAKCLLLGEEVGELFKAVRKDQNIKVDKNSKFGTIDNELADILTYLCAIANKYDIDLEKAFREKEEKSKKRTWE